MFIIKRTIAHPDAVSPDDASSFQRDVMAKLYHAQFTGRVQLLPYNHIMLYRGAEYIRVSKNPISTRSDGDIAIVTGSHPTVWCKTVHAAVIGALAYIGAM